MTVRKLKAALIAATLVAEMTPMAAQALPDLAAQYAQGNCLGLGIDPTSPEWTPCIAHYRAEYIAMNPPPYNPCGTNDVCVY